VSSPPPPSADTLLFQYATVSSTLPRCCFWPLACAQIIAHLLATLIVFIASCCTCVGLAKSLPMPSVSMRRRYCSFTSSSGGIGGSICVTVGFSAGGTVPKSSGVTTSASLQPLLSSATRFSLSRSYRCIVLSDSVYDATALSAPNFFAVITSMLSVSPAAAPAHVNVSLNSTFAPFSAAVLNLFAAPHATAT